MNVCKVFLILACLFFVESISAKCRSWDSCWSNDTKNKASATVDNVEEATKKAWEDTEKAAIKAREDTERAAKKAWEDTERAAIKAREDTQKAAIKARIDTQNVIQDADRQLDTTTNAIRNEASHRTEQFNAISTDIDNRSRSELNNIKNSTSQNIGYIQEKSQQEIQRATEDVVNTSQQLDQYVRENPVDKEGLESAFSAAAAAKNSNLGKSVKKFGIQVNKSIDDVESSEPAKALKDLGTEASMENIENGTDNTIENLDSSEAGRSLHGLGKKASTEKIIKGVTNTIDYWQQPDIGSKIDPTNPNSDTRQVVKETIHDVESSELAQELNDAGTQVSIENIEKGVDKRIADIKKTPLYKKLQETLLSTVLTKPTHIQLVDPKHYYTDHDHARPVYYVNGWMTSFENGHFEAEFLGKMIGRPVYFLYNSTACTRPGVELILTCSEDVAEAVLDRAWPSLLLPGLIGLPAQHNTTTKELAYILYHENGPITIVSHSQGTLITRNALMTVALLGKETKMIKEVEWTATGMPMQNFEIWPKLENFHLHVNPNDIAAAVGGQRGGGHTVEAIDAGGETHEPTCNYFPRIYNLDSDKTKTDFRLTKGPYKAFLSDGRKLLTQCSDYSQAGTPLPSASKTRPDPESKMPYAVDVSGYY